MEEGKLLQLCVGIDLAKKSHVATFISQGSKKANERPLTFSNSRAGFEQLLEAMGRHAPPGRCAVLIEKTGHYGIALEQFLQSKGIALYRVQNQKRLGKQKTDASDAKALANLLFNRVVVDTRNDLIKIYRVLPPTEIAAKLHGFVQYRAELNTEITRVSNKLTALYDEAFPEFEEIFTDPNGPAALAFREKFPLPADIAAASLEELLACRPHTRPGNAGLVRLQELAKDSIGNRDPARLTSLCLEQKHLIKRLRLLQADMESVEAEIIQIVETSREGKILVSIPGISPTQAGILIAGIGNIANFERASHLRGYCGWSPVYSQSGASLDSVKLDKGGNRQLKYTIYLIGRSLVHHDTEFHDIYDRLVPRKCIWDERKQAYRGKNKALGRICGQLIGMIFLFLRRDYDMLAVLPPGTTPPEPMLYDREIHREDRMGRDYVPYVKLRSKGLTKIEELKEPKSGADRVWLLLQQDATLEPRELVKLAKVSSSVASKTRIEYYKEHDIPLPKTSTERMLELLAQHPQLSANELAEQTGCHVTHARRIRRQHPPPPQQ